eukprot:GFUD01091038.1.p1 GENE.GFUD01091038.1~~GFUD01091038.1.p1  ORF type:complete len:179 (+),score=49.83 GFUD01091038.1:41-538(+)
MTDSQVNNTKRSQSWLSKVFKRLFVCQQKKKKKTLKRYVSFRSIQLKTPDHAENNNVTENVPDKVISSSPLYDPDMFQRDILQSRENLKSVKVESAREDPSTNDIQTVRSRTLSRRSRTKPSHNESPCNGDFNDVSTLETVQEEGEDEPRKTSISLAIRPVTRWV